MNTFSCSIEYYTAVKANGLEMHITTPTGTSLVTQWLRICLPMQGTLVQSLAREDPTCCGAAKPMCHNY